MISLFPETRFRPTWLAHLKEYISRQGKLIAFFQLVYQSLLEECGILVDLTIVDNDQGHVMTDQRPWTSFTKASPPAI